MQNFGGRKFWRIWRITGDSSKFSCPKFSLLISEKHARIGVMALLKYIQLKSTCK